MAATQKKLIDTTVNLDASFDLHAAGYPNDDDAQYDFEAAYEGAAHDIGTLLGVRISVDTHPEPGQPAEEEGSWAQQVDLWQVIHSCLSHDDEDGWNWTETKTQAAAKEIKRKLS